MTAPSALTVLTAAAETTTPHQIWRVPQAGSTSASSPSDCSAPEGRRVILLHPVCEGDVKEGRARLGGEDRRVC